MFTLYLKLPPTVNFTSSPPKPKPSPATVETLRSSKIVPLNVLMVSLTFAATPNTLAIRPVEASKEAILPLPEPIRLEIRFIIVFTSEFFMSPLDIFSIFSIAEFPFSSFFMRS